LKRLIYAASVILAVSAAGLSAAPAQAASPGNVLPCSPKRTDLLIYEHGMVEGNTSVTLIFWGSWWNTNAQAAPVITELTNLFGGLRGASWAKTVTQYCDAYGNQPYTSQRPGVLSSAQVDPSKVPAAPTRQQMTDEAAKYAFVPNGLGPFAVGVPMIITPPGVTPVGDGPVGSTTSAECGHHSWGPVAEGGVNINIQWADVPYGVISATPVCKPTGTAQGLSVTAGHEWAETVTDPYIGGSGAPARVQTAWAAKGTQHPADEIGDLCEGPTDIYGNPVKDFWLKLSTGRFWMQPLWSNEAGPSAQPGACVDGS
jgi:hypothetical protein